MTKIGDHEIRTLFQPRNQEENEQFQATLKQWLEDGWDVVPGMQPITIFPLVKMREPAQPQQGGIGGMGVLHIKDSDVIHRDKDGKRINADRTPYIEVPETKQ